MRTINDVYRNLLRKVLSKGTVTTPRGFICKEIDGFQVCLDMSHPELTLKERNCNRHFMIAEFLWILAGRNDLKFVETFNSKMASFSDNGKTLYGAYGQGIGKQLQNCLDVLQKDISSRQAVITFWKPNPKKSKDIPCTIGLHFMVRDGYLNCYSHMRSNDLWLGFPYDVYTFSMISKFLADNLEVKLGYLMHNADSMHLYDQHLTAVKMILREKTEEQRNIAETRLNFCLPFMTVTDFQKELSLMLDQVLMKEDDLSVRLPEGIDHLITQLQKYMEKK